MPEETKKVLERLANRPDVFVAIVSGRTVADVKAKVGINGEFRRLDVFSDDLFPNDKSLTKPNMHDHCKPYQVLKPFHALRFYPDPDLRDSRKAVGRKCVCQKKSSCLDRHTTIA